MAEIDFTPEERIQYNNIQQKQIALYEALKLGGSINKHYFKLTSALLPLRLACSGGQLEEGQVKTRAARSPVTPRRKQPVRTGNELEMDINEEEECAICLELIENPRATPCQPVPHVFCRECIEGVFSGEPTSIPCPCCRNKIRADGLRDVVPKPLPFVNASSPTPSTSGNGDKKKTAKKLALEESDIMFRSKFERLLKELNTIRETEPECK